MRPPWLGNSQETAELEALQTDVMRFVAILGLCLAAIFSLVHSAAVERSAPQQSPPADKARPAEVKVTLVQQPAAPVKTVSPVPESTPAPSPPAPEPAGEPSGFTLEFASVQALESLLRAGTVQLYASVDDRFWQMDASRRFVQAAAPASYYDMHPATVPPGLREALEQAANSGTTVWGVTLPQGITGQIDQLVAGQQGGSLVIGPDASVRLE